MHTDDRWLSKGKFLQRFRDFIDKTILTSRGEENEQLYDEKWLSDLAFLIDTTFKLGVA